MSKRFTRVALCVAGAFAASASPALAANLVVSAHKASSGCAQKAQYSTISAAVAAANPGDQITVCPGTYQEQVLINKANLQLQTQGNTPATIKAPQTLNSADNGAIVTISAPQVKILGFTITSSGIPGNPGSLKYGVYIMGGGSGDLEKDDISNINDDPLSGDQNGVAVQAGFAGDNTTPATVGYVTLKNDTIENYQKNGVTVDGPGSIGDIENNVVIGSGPGPNIAQNGIQVSNGASATVKNNVVSDNVYNADYSSCNATSSNQNGCTTATGILLFQAGKTDVEQNTLSTNDTALYDYDPTATGTPAQGPPGGPNPPGGNATATLNNNTITDSTFDGLVINTDTTGAQVQNTNVSGTWGHAAYGQDNGDGIDVFATTKAQIQNSMAEGNSEDGIHAEAGTTGNKFNGNQAFANLVFDCEDGTGATPSTIANVWTADMGDLNSPQFICQGTPTDNVPASGSVAGVMPAIKSDQALPSAPTNATHPQVSPAP